MDAIDCVKNVQIQSFFWFVFSCIRNEYDDFFVFSPNTGKCGPEQTPYLDTFLTVIFMNSKNSRTSDPDRILLNFRDKINW